MSKKFFKQNYIELQSVSSTNTWALENSEYLDPDTFHIIWTRRQTAGRGTQGRKWTATEGESLTVSYAFFIEGLTSSFSPISLVCSTSLRKALLHYPFKRISIKWPNDLLASKKKIAGILVETKDTQGRCFVVIGIGVNILQKDLSAIDCPATSIFLETGSAPSVEEVLQEVSLQLHEDIPLFLEHGFAVFADEFNTHLFRPPSCQIRLRDGRILLGTIQKADEKGNLQFLTHNNELIRLASGEVVIPIPVNIVD